jgi:hypothetical protein
MTNRISQGPATQVDYQCDTNINNPSGAGGHMDARGVTYWRGDTNQYTLSPGSQLNIQFTCTQPRCYQTTDNCNVFFRTYVLYNPNNDVDVTLHWMLNNNDFSYHNIPGTGHGNFQATDVGTSSNYNSNGQNTFSIINTSTTATVRVDNVQVIRVYGMCGLGCDCQGECVNSTECIGGAPCTSESYVNPSGDFVTRVDYPCNLDGNGTRGYTYYLDKYFTGTDDTQQNYSVIQPGDSLEWDFNWYWDSQHIYQNQEVALFNFNQILVYVDDDNQSQNDDIELDAFLNGSSVPFAKYYLSKKILYVNGAPTGLFPSFDLATLGSEYNDSGANYVQLKNMSDVRVQMSNGVNGDGVNIYRTYVTTGTSCQCCEIQCQTCYGGQSCFVCDACYIACQFCYACDTCYTACQSCYTCDACNSCNTGCEVACQSCQPCETCQPCEGCQTACYDCCYAYEICYGCEYVCYSCQSCY